MAQRQEPRHKDTSLDRKYQWLVLLVSVLWSFSFAPLVLANRVTVRPTTDFEFDDVEVDFAATGTAFNSPLLGIEQPAGTLLDLTFSDFTGLFTDFTAHVDITNTDLRIGVELFADAQDAKASGQLGIAADYTYDSKVLPGQKTTLVIAELSPVANENTVLEIGGPQFSAGARVVAEGSVTLSLEVFDGNGDTYVDDDGITYKADFPLEMNINEKLFEIGNGVPAFTFPSIGPASIGLNVPGPADVAASDIALTINDNGNLQANGQATADPFATLNLDIDQVIAQLTGTGISIDDSATGGLGGLSVSPAGVSMSIGFDPLNFVGALNLIDIPLTGGLAINNEYEYIVQGALYSNFRVMDESGAVVATDLVPDEGPPGGDGLASLIFEYTVPEDAENGDELTLMVDLHPNATLEGITNLVGTLDGEIEILEATLSVGGVSVVSEALIELPIPLGETRPFELGSYLNQMGVDDYGTATLELTTVVVPEPGSIVLLACGGWLLLRRTGRQARPSAKS